MSMASHVESVRARFPAVTAAEAGGALAITSDAPAIRDILLFLRDELRFDHMNFMTALDRPGENRMEVVYRLFSYASKDAAVLRVNLPRDGAAIATVSDIYRTAEWHERETAEMFGIAFDGHPDPRKILLPDSITGHPLRKDFTHPNMIRLPEVK
jgi:NADH-quinone oxidoreductase subunit C